METKIKNVLAAYLFECHALTVNVIYNIEHVPFDTYKENADNLIDRYCKILINIIEGDE